MNAPLFVRPRAAPAASQERSVRPATPLRRDRPAEDVGCAVAATDPAVPAPALTAHGQIVHLPPGTARSLRTARGVVLRCIAGVAWITQTGCGEDVTLGPGDTHAPRRRGKIVLQPLTRTGAVVVVASDTFTATAKGVQHEPAR